MVPKLDEQRGIDHNDGLRILLTDLLRSSVHFLLDPMMRYLIQKIPLLRIGEDDGSQFFSMNGPFLIEDFLSKYADQFIPDRCVRLNQLPGDLVCIDDVSALFAKYFGNGRLSTCHLSRHSDDEHSFNPCSVVVTKEITGKFEIRISTL
jgi:hypothetical protein